MITDVKGVDPRVRRTRQLLQQALMELSHEKNFASITVQDIAERATVNQATFYAHFEDKYELLDSIIREKFQKQVASKLPTASREGVNDLRELIGAVFDFIGVVHSRCKPTDTRFEPLFERPVQQELSELLVSWLKQVPASGVGRRSENPHERRDSRPGPDRAHRGGSTSHSWSLAGVTRAIGMSNRLFVQRKWYQLFTRSGFD